MNQDDTQSVIDIATETLTKNIAEQTTPIVRNASRQLITTMLEQVERLTVYEMERRQQDTLTRFTTHFLQKEGEHLFSLPHKEQKQWVHGHAGLHLVAKTINMPAKQLAKHVLHYVKEK